ncbi:MAG: hypothetical protein AAB553_03385 [Patescibacteria group bacterium]
MKPIELTDTTKIPYLFADKVTTKKDVIRTKRLLKKVYTYMLEFKDVETPPSSISNITKSKKRCRIIMYDYKKLIKQREMHVVIFCGNQRKNLSKEFLKEYFNVDWEIVASMQESNTFLCYASQELADGNWFNLVLFTELAGKVHVTSKEKHSYAAYTLAQKKFSWVRLHNATLSQGLQDYQNIEFTKTSYYNFDSMWFAKRLYQ